MAGPVDTRFPQRTHVPLRSCASRASANSSHSTNDSLLSAAAHTPRITRSIGTDRQLGHVLRMTTTMLPKNHRMRGVRALWQSCGSAGGGLASAGRGTRAAAHRTRAPRACSLPSSAMLYSLLHLGGFPGDVEFYRGRTAGVARMLDLAPSRSPVDTPFLAPRRAPTELPPPHPQAPRGSSSSVRAMGGLALRCVRTHSTRASLWRVPGWRRHSSPLLPLPPPPP